MKDILVIVSTCNRIDLTGLTLSSVRENRSGASDVLVLDDASTAYDAIWLTKWGFEFERRQTTVGVGRAARARYERFLLSEYRYLCALDNDLLVCPQFDLRLYELWHRLPHDNNLTILTGYHSVTQQVLSESDSYVEVDGVGGACHFLDRATAQAALEKMEPVWPHNWDHCISRVYEKKFAPKRSFVQHLGIFGGGVNGASADIAVDSQATLNLHPIA